MKVVDPADPERKPIEVMSDVDYELPATHIQSEDLPNLDLLRPDSFDLPGNAVGSYNIITNTLQGYEGTPRPLRMRVLRSLALTN